MVRIARDRLDIPVQRLQALVHTAVDAAVELVVRCGVFGLGAKTWPMRVICARKFYRS